LETALSVKNLSKKYGRINAVNDISFEVQRGSVFGILGPNGSGKTTTLGIILDIILPNGGEYYWFGKKSSKENRKKIGSILETPNFYPYLSAVKNLQIISEIKDLPIENIETSLKTVGLYERRNSSFKTFSLGMKQRLAIASAIIGNPEVIILDEPTNGLDPQGIFEIRELIKQIAAQGTTVILASHLLDEVQKVCTHFAILKSGKILFKGNAKDLSHNVKSFEISSDDNNKLYEILKNYNEIKSISKEENILVATCSNEVSAVNINSYLFSKDVTLSHLVLRKESLEKQFLEILNETR